MRKIISLAAIAAIAGTVIATHLESNAAQFQATEASTPVS